jgi:hypothetical protein
MILEAVDQEICVAPSLSLVEVAVPYQRFEFLFFFLKDFGD